MPIRMISKNTGLSRFLCKRRLRLSVLAAQSAALGGGAIARPPLLFAFER